MSGNHSAVHQAHSAGGSGKHPATVEHTGKPKPGGHASGGRDIAVHTQALGDYATKAGHIADELNTLAGHKLAAVHSLGEDTFGGLGKDAGFTTALADFGAVIGAEVDELGKVTGEMADAVAKIKKEYDKADSDGAHDFAGLTKGLES